jgi:hypothetical protein
MLRFSFPLSGFIGQLGRARPRRRTTSYRPAVAAESVLAAGTFGRAAGGREPSDPDFDLLDPARVDGFFAQNGFLGTRISI